MERFQRIDDVALPFPQANLNTDQILPGRYLQKPRAVGFKDFLFRDLRFRADGSENPEFALNDPVYRRARIIVGERNFGCGSSREHAAWALFDYGFRCAIAPSFGDIFQSNALKNGLLPVVLPEPVVTRILAMLLATPGARLAVDLVAQAVTAPNGSVYPFEVNAFAKQCLITGQDELDYTLAQGQRIAAFEQGYVD
jgi:3-isopropylmalate/(R)-2-methylmalate dehydratase small subunit